VLLSLGPSCFVLRDRCRLRWEFFLTQLGPYAPSLPPCIGETRSFDRLRRRFLLSWLEATTLPGAPLSLYSCHSFLTVSAPPSFPIARFLTFDLPFSFRGYAVEVNCGRFTPLCSLMRAFYPPIFKGLTVCKSLFLTMGLLVDVYALDSLTESPANFLRFFSFPPIIVRLGSEYAGSCFFFSEHGVSQREIFPSFVLLPHLLPCGTGGKSPLFAFSPSLLEGVTSPFISL